MLEWKAQGAACAADLPLMDGRRATAVIVADRQNPRGLVLLVQENATAPVPMMLDEAGDLVAVGHWVEILAMQERAFGTCGLPKPELRA